MSYILNLWNQLDRYAMLRFLLQILAVLLALTVHEACHGLAAYLLGDATAKRQNRISLNPLNHIDWVGFAAMLLCGFGWAKPVSVDPRHFRNEKLGMALTALAGPFGNFLLTVLCLLFIRFAPFENQALFYTVSYTAQISMSLGIFNLIPLPPLDGSKVLAVLLPKAFYDRWMYYERYGIVLVLALVYFGVLDKALTTAFQTVFSRLVDFILSL